MICLETIIWLQNKMNIDGYAGSVQTVTSK